VSNTNECPGCGSSLKDREAYRKSNKDDTISLDLRSCPHCGSLKCCMCDGGDDVECLSCDTGDDS
jgi:hypothetical protein